MLGPRGGFDCVCTDFTSHLFFLYFPTLVYFNRTANTFMRNRLNRTMNCTQKKKKNLMTTWFLTQFLQQQKKTSHRVAPLIVWLFSQKQFYDLLDRDVLLHVFNESSRSVHCFFSRSERGRPNCTQRVKCHLTWRLCRDLLLKKKKKKVIRLINILVVYFICRLPSKCDDDDCDDDDGDWQLGSQVGGMWVTAPG